jgi:hypothetical protein
MGYSNNFTFLLPKLDHIMDCMDCHSDIKMVIYEQELRLQKLKKLNKNWIVKLTEKIKII